MENLCPSAVVDGFSYGEGPRWHDCRLWFSDVARGAVLAVDETGHLEVVVATEHPSGLGWMPDGTLVVSTLYEAKIKRITADGTVAVQDLSDWAWSTNDLVVTAGGTLYLDLYKRTDAGIAGEIAMVTPDSRVRVVAGNLATPNGLGITPDGSTLLASETAAGRVLAFTLSADGSLTEQRVFAELGEGRHPDGLCVDAEGAVWVGSYDTSEFLRVVDGGKVTHCVKVDRGWAVAPALGGPDRRTLYLVIDETTHQGMQSGQSCGRIECVRVDVPGAGWP